jgi:uncharacterized protein YyaL (SSP411 family)
MLGEQDKALEVYKAALQTYEDVTGTDHTSYATTLTNLGVLYKDMSKGRNVFNAGESGEASVQTVPVQGAEKEELLSKAEAALTEARATRLKLLGNLQRSYTAR